MKCNMPCAWSSLVDNGCGSAQPRGGGGGGGGAIEYAKSMVIIGRLRTWLSRPIGSFLDNCIDFTYFSIISGDGVFKKDSQTCS